MYVEHSVEIFQAVWRVLRDDGTFFLNLGDSYFGGGGGNYGTGLSTKAHKTHPSILNKKKHEYLKPKDLIGVPWRVALALQKAGW